MVELVIPDWEIIVFAVSISFATGIFVITNENQHKQARRDINKLTFWVKKLLKHNNCIVDDKEYELSLNEN